MNPVHQPPAPRATIFGWELLAASATLAAALTWGRGLTEDTERLADRIGRARHQLDALLEVQGPVRAMSPALEGDAPVEGLRARLGAQDWVALFGGRAVTLVPSVTGSGWTLVLEAKASASCTTP